VLKMKKTARKSNVGTVILFLILVSSVFVFAGDVIVQEGLIEGVKFQSTGCTATGTKLVALGYETEASGDYCTAIGYQTTANYQYDLAMGYGTIASGGISTAMGYDTEASGNCSTAMGGLTTASGYRSTAMGSQTTASGSYSTAMGGHTLASGAHATAMGYSTEASGSISTAIGDSVLAGPASSTTAIGKSFTNNVADSFAVGYGQKDFSVQSGQVNVYGDFDVSQKITMGTLVLPTDNYDPPSGDEGQIYLNTMVDKVRVYVDGEWKSLAWE
jgi:hypothetical protein